MPQPFLSVVIPAFNEERRIVSTLERVRAHLRSQPYAAEVLVVDSPGAHPCRLAGVNYKNLRPGVRLGPGGPVFTGE